MITKYTNLVKTMEYRRINQEYRNFVSIYAGLAFIGEKLEDYTEQKLRETYSIIHRKLAGKPLCRQQCSKLFKNDTAKWCNTCDSWRKELQKTLATSRKVLWSSMDSSKWPTGHKEIAEVYLPSSWDGSGLNDVSTACQIWTNLTKCNINKSTIQRLRQVRNKYYAHNPSQSATEHDKALAFDVFRDLLIDADVQCHIDPSGCLGKLSKIKDGRNDRELENIEASLEELQNMQTFAILKKYLLKVWIFLKQIVQRIKFYWRGCKKNYMITLLIVIFLYSVLFPGENVYKQECLSEDYSYPFEQDMPLFGYLSEHQTLIGRQWLFLDIRESILKNSGDVRKNFIALVAEIGYGKSALVAHMLCSGRDSPAYMIRKHIVGFHICKFDVRSTHAPERFIRRLVGFLARRSAAYGQIISMLPKNSLLYNTDECSKDHVACFDQGITIPLKQLKEIENPPWIVVIDALDECETSDDNGILELLLSRSRHFPKFLKFLITSRNTTSLRRLRRLELHHLVANDVRNIKDITDYIQQHIDNSASNSNLVNELVNYSEGNFVYVVQAIKYLIENSNFDEIPKLPNDLEDIYEINFNRKYQSDDLYKIPKMILEIICSAVNPIGKFRIYQILNKNNVTQNITEFDKHFHSLSFFLSVNDNVRLVHQALFHWLVSQKNVNYRISLKRGNALISRYLLSFTSTLGPMDLVDLVIHVSNSDDPTLAELFQSADFSTNIVESNSLLHKLIWKTSSIQPLKLLLEHTEIIDDRSKGGVTPIFVAASKGHLDQLELLHKKGADLNFQVVRDFLIEEKDVHKKIARIKQEYYSGYTLLHIASQNGHFDVAKYLIQQNQNLILVKNSVGLTPGLVACENGFLNILKEMFYKYRKSFGYDCLYYASKNNHVDVVKWLVSKDVEFRCISSRMSVSAIKAITELKDDDSFKLKVAMFPPEWPMTHLVYPLDKWWRVFKFDPLLEGIRHGSIQTAQYLMETFPQSLKCSDVFGFSAALTCAVFNRSELLPFMTYKLKRDKCSSVPVYIRESSLTFVQDMLSKNTCPEGGRLAHLLAIHKQKNIFTYAVQHGLVRDWNVVDKKGFLPVHYAAEHFNVEVMRHYHDQGHLFKNAKDNNGVTVYHIAAKNGLLAKICSVKNNFLKEIPDLHDDHNLSILHYVVSHKFDALFAEADFFMDEFAQLFEHLIKYHQHKLMSRDRYYRNVLHYALRNGHFEIVNYLYRFKKSSVQKMLVQKDIYGDNPITFALKRDKLVFLPPLATKCFYFEIFHSNCATDWKEYASFMSSWEISLLLAIEKMSKHEFKELLEPHLSLVWSKSVHLLTTIIHNHHQYINTALLSDLLVLQDDSEVVRFNQLVLAYFVPSVFKFCPSNSIPTDSPLLFIIRNFDFESTFFSLINVFTNVAFNNIILSAGRTNLNCADKNGYNLVYHAVKTGNIQTARLLIENGLMATSSAVDIKGIFLAALTSRRRIAETNFHTCSSSKHLSQTACIDLFLTEILKLKRMDLKSGDFCKNGTADLTLIHILSANGMLQSLEILVKTFSPRILQCYNQDRFTPLYLAQIFGEDDVVSFISNTTSAYLPDRYAEEYLILSLLHNFPLKDYSKCYKMHVFNRRRFGHWYYCASSIQQQLLLSKQYYLQKSAAIIENVLDIFYKVVACKDYFDIHYRANSLPKCEKFVKICFRCYGNIVSLQKYFREFDVLKSIRQLPPLANLSKLERIIESAMQRLIKVSENEFCLHFQNLTVDAVHSSILNTLSYGQRSIRELVITYFLRLKKFETVHVPHEYSFLRSRMAIFGLSESFQGSKTIPVTEEFIPKAHNFYYLNILRDTLIYKQFRENLEKDFTAVIVYDSQCKSLDLESVRLEDPFKDFR